MWHDIPVFLYCSCCITKSIPPFLPSIIQYSFIKKRYQIPFPCLWKSFQSWISITLNSPQCFSPCLCVYGAVRVGFCPVIIKTKGKSRSVNQFLLPKGLLPVYMLLCEQRLDILPLWVRTQNLDTPNCWTYLYVLFCNIESKLSLTYKLHGKPMAW